MSTHTTGSFPQALFNTGTMWYQLAQSQLAEQYSKVFEIMSSNSQFEHADGFVGLGSAVRKRQGENIVMDSTNQGYHVTTENLTYGLGFRCTEESIKYNKYPQLMKERSMELSRAHSRCREIKAASVLNNAFSSSFVGADGVELCSASHVYHRSGGTWSNMPSSAYDISEWAIEQLVYQIKDTRDERGNKILLEPQRLIVPLQLEAEVVRITGSPEQYGTAERNLNAIYKLGWFPQGHVIMNYLTDPDAWFIQTNQPKGLIFYNVASPEFSEDRDFYSNDYLYKAIQMFSCNFIDPRCIFGSAGGS